MSATASRPYRMTARAHAAQATADRILDAAIELFFTDPGTEPSLEDIAKRAQTTKQTVLRRFGTKADLITAASERALDRVKQERDGVPPGDVEGAVRTVVAHYERIGDGVLRMLAEEHRSPKLREDTDLGRALHAQWCERVFGRGSERRHAQLIAITDVYTWKLLRRDRGLSRRETELAMRELIEGVIG